MRRLSLLILILLIAGAAKAQTYSTTFPATENPIAEGGIWRNGATNGVAWGDVRTTGGHAIGTTFSATCVGGTPSNCNDSVAIITAPSFTDEQVCSTIYLNPALSRNAQAYELELHTHMTISANNITGYEFNYSTHNDGAQYAQIVRWNGPKDSFTVLPGGVTPQAMANGDTFCASSVGSTHKSWIVHNGVKTQLASTTDSTYTGGSPGIGMFNGGSSDASADVNYGFSSFTANNPGSPCLVENFNDFEGSTSGTVATSPLIANGQHGYSGTGFTIISASGTSVTFGTAANEPLSSPSGVLCGDTTNYAARQGTTGIVMQGTGSASHNAVQINTLPTQLQLPALQAAFWVCFNMDPVADGSINYDIGDVHAGSYFSAYNVHTLGTANSGYLNLETVNGNGPNTVGIKYSLTDCTAGPPAAPNWYKTILTMGCSACGSGGAGIPDSLFVYDTTGTLVGSISRPSTNTGNANQSYIGCPGGNIHAMPTNEACFFDSWQLASTAVNLAPTPPTPTCRAASASSTDVQTALNSCLTGGTVIIPVGAATWTTQVFGHVTGAVTIQGQTQCTGGCTPGTEGIGLAFNDGVTNSMSTCNAAAATCITMSDPSNAALNLSGCSATNLCRVTGLTVSNTTGNSPLNGAISLGGTHLQVSSRFDHIHALNSQGTLVTGTAGQGLIDHVLYNGLSGQYSFSSFQGDFSTGGFLNWEDPTNLGSIDAYFLEDSNFTLSDTNASGLTDGNFGCKIVIRHNQLTGGNGAGITHGTDSGGFRSCVAVEIYNNTFTSVAHIGHVWGSRGGVTLFHDNVLTGANIWQSISQDYYREGLPTNPGVPSYGLARPGLQFSLAGPVSNSNSVVLNPKAPVWIASNVYALNTLSNLSGCNAQVTVAGTSGTTQPACPASGSTIGDGSVTWIGIGGGVGTPPGTPPTNASFLSTDNETPCSSGANCTRFFDTPGHPYRDQPGTMHGQVVFGSYQWNNTGSQAPANFWGSNAPNAVQLNRDFFNATPTGYAPAPYPHFLQTGATPPPTVLITPSALNFGTLRVGTTSAPQILTIQNTGSVNLTWTTYSTSNPANATFTASPGTCPTSNSSGLAPGNSCTVSVTALTNAQGLQSGTFNFPSNAGTQVIPLSITGIANAATPVCVPGSGSYAGTQSVTCSTSSGSIMCFTVDGSTPATNGGTGCMAGTLYTGAISVPASLTLEIIAGGTNFNDSGIGTFTYSIGFLIVPPAPAIGAFAP